MTGPRRLLVTGTRHGRRDVTAWLDRYAGWAGLPAELVVGGAPGVDEQAEAWAISRGVAVRRVMADWSRGRRAGPERNAVMVALCAPGDDCLAFPLPGSIGTHDCADKARRAGLRVHVLPVLSP